MGMTPVNLSWRSLNQSRLNNRLQGYTQIAYLNDVAWIWMVWTDLAAKRLFKSVRAPNTVHHAIKLLVVGHKLGPNAIQSIGKRSKNATFSFPQWYDFRACVSSFVWENRVRLDPLTDRDRWSSYFRLCMFGSFAVMPPNRLLFDFISRS